MAIYSYYFTFKNMTYLLRDGDDEQTGNGSCCGGCGCGYTA